ncbi:MAG: type I restriction-modification system subunit M [Longimonas sp.]|uniref:type I restriction-modification system subunit M n=1 Tax=Longimonas sp. TaxID=2039626 RepID=UPI00334572FA
MANRKPSQAEINRTLWQACDTFRGVVDPAEYKNYILTMLFVKYISDVWQDHYEAYQEEYDNERLIQRKMERERFVLPEKATFDHIASKKDAPDIGQVINKALEKIEEANKRKLEGVFRNIDFNSEAALGQTKDRNRRLKNLIQDFNKPVLDFRPSVVGTEDIIGNAYMYLISRFASDAGKKGGEFYTPDEVSTLLAKLVDPDSGDRIYDPAIGSGSLAIKVAEEVGDRNVVIYGQESNGSTWALCRMNMFLHGMDHAEIAWGDTINSPEFKSSNDTLETFDVVVANPPFSLKKWGKADAKTDPFDRFHRGLPPKSRGDYAFLSHMIESAVEGTGRVGVIVPHGVLFRSRAEGRIRQALIEENLLDAVVGLPEKLFFGTGIPAAILIFDKSRSDDEDVVFIDASREYEEGTKQNVLREQDIEKIVTTYRQRTEIDKYSYVAPVAEIAENDFNLNIPRYVDTFEPEPEIDVAAVQQEIESLESELADTRQTINEHLKALELID